MYFTTKVFDVSVELTMMGILSQNSKTVATPVRTFPTLLMDSGWWWKYRKIHLESSLASVTEIIC